MSGPARRYDLRIFVDGFRKRVSCKHKSLAQQMLMTLTLFHTSPANVSTFDGLLAELAPSGDVTVQHVVDESILREARDVGRLTPAMQWRVEQRVQNLLAEDGGAVVLCTCSTVGACAEGAGAIRVDRPMVARAVTLATHRVIIAVTLHSTLGPTRALVLDEVSRAGKALEIVEVFCDGAWAHFERGEKELYLCNIANAVRGVARTGDAVVLAQASMVGAEKYCADLDVPVLSSPRIGLAAALAALANLRSTQPHER
jgi:hypothetical protein